MTRFDGIETRVCLADHHCQRRPKGMTRFDGIETLASILPLPSVMRLKGMTRFDGIETFTGAFNGLKDPGILGDVLTFSPFGILVGHSLLTSGLQAIRV